MNRKSLKGNARITMGQNIARMLWAIAGILLSIQMGMECVGYLSFSIITIWFVYEILGPSFYVSMSKLIYARMRKEQYRNAQTIKRTGFFCCVLVALIITVLLFAMSEILCLYIMKEPMFLFPFLLIIPGLFFILVNSVVEGFCAGNGFASYLGRIIHLLLFVLLTQLFRILLRDTGNHVSTLLRSYSYQHLYDGIALSISFSVSALLSFIANLIIYHMVGRQLSATSRRTDTRVIESSALAARIFTTSLFTHLPRNIALGALFPLQFLFIWLKADQTTGVIERISQYGSLICCCFLCGLFLLAVFECICVRPIFEGAGLYRKEDYNRLNDSILDTRHNLGVTALPTAVFICVLAKHLCGFLTGADGTIWIPNVMIIGISIYFGSIAIYQIDLCREIGFLTESNLTMLGSLIIAIISFIAMFDSEEPTSIYALSISWLLFFVLITLATAFLLNRRLGMNEELIKSLLFPIIISALSGLVVLGFSKVFSTILSDTALFFIGMTIGYLIQSLLTVLLHNISMREVRKFSGIFLIRIIGRITGYL